MIPIELFPHQDIFILGLGNTGMSVARALLSGQANVLAWDDTPERREAAKRLGVRVTAPDRVEWGKVKTMVISPGIPHSNSELHPAVILARQYAVPITNDIDLFGRILAGIPPGKRPKIIGITGTNGKSTTTTLIGHILRSENKVAHVGGNIGVCVFDLPPPSAEAYYVLELSSYQLELADSLHCDVSILLNLSPDHLDRHGSMENYIRAKARIFNNQNINDTCIIGFDSLVTQAFAMTPDLRGNGKFVPISTRYVSSTGVCVIDGQIHANTGGKAELLGNIEEAYALKGEHSAQNAAAAFAACSALHLRSDRIVEAMKTFQGLPHRLEFVTEDKGVRYVNDSKATNPEAASFALRAFPDSFWIAGGKAKSGKLDALFNNAKQAKMAFLYGECADAFAGALNPYLPVARFETLKDAFWAAQSYAEKTHSSQTILFSPAAASFDQYKNFEERGEAFKSLVLAATQAERA